MVTIERIPRPIVMVLRNEAKDARDGTMVVHGIDIDMAELLEEAADEIERLRKAVQHGGEVAYGHDYITRRLDYALKRDDLTIEHARSLMKEAAIVIKGRDAQIHSAPQAEPIRSQTEGEGK